MVPLWHDSAKYFEAYKKGAVQVDIVEVNGWTELFPEIVNEATSQIGLYDGFITLPLATGSVVEHDG